MSLRLSLSQRFPALASRDFAIFWVGHLLSLIGTSMQNTAQPLLAYRLSGRPFDLGLIGFAVTLPMFFLAIPGGVLVEHWDKRKTVMVLQAILMLDTFILAFLALTDLIQIWHIVLLSLINGIAIAFEITARQAMLIELVGREALPNAVALQSTAFNISRVLGPALVAPFMLLIPNNGEGWIFLLNGISFITIIVGLTFVRTHYRVPSEPQAYSMWSKLSEGINYIGRNSSVGSILIIAATLGIFAFPIIQQMPVVSTDLLGQAGDTKAAIDTRNSLLYASQGMGALIAAFSMAVNNSRQRHQLRMLLGEAGFILGMMIIPFSRSLFPTLGLVAVMGWSLVIQQATMTTLVQLQVPNGLRGRVFSIYLWSLQGVTPLGSLLIGWMTQRWNLSVTATVCGLICLVIVGGTQAVRPVIRRVNPANSPGNS